MKISWEKTDVGDTGAEGETSEIKKLRYQLNRSHPRFTVIWRVKK